MEEATVKAASVVKSSVSTILEEKTKTVLQKKPILTLCFFDLLFLAFVIMIIPKGLLQRTVSRLRVN